MKNPQNIPEEAFFVAVRPAKLRICKPPPQIEAGFPPQTYEKGLGTIMFGGQDPVSWDGYVAIGSGVGTIVELVLTGDLRMLRRCHVRHEPVFACLTSRPRFVSPSHPFSSGLNRGKNVRFPD